LLLSLAARDYSSPFDSFAGERQPSSALFLFSAFCRFASRVYSEMFTPLIDYRDVRDVSS